MTYKPSPIYIEDSGISNPVFKTDSGERVTILKDSFSEMGYRLTTMELTYYRGIHSEFMTHRVFSRNSASSRAVPVMKMIRKVLENPYVPQYWGAYQKGMQAHKEIENPQEKVSIWLEARNDAVSNALSLLFGNYEHYLNGDERDLLQIVDTLSKRQIPTDAPHKQIVNRILEPYMWHTVIVTATDYMNFFDLRAHEDSDPAIQQLAYMMIEAYDSSLPEPVEYGEWHLPLVTKEEEYILGTRRAQMVSTARCARVSYLTHDGVRDFEKDLELYAKLVTGKPHASPLEHVATPAKDGDYILGNFSGWHQFRGVMFGSDQDV